MSNKQVTIKIGYIKSMQGEVSKDIQINHLVHFGVDPEHIFDGDAGETVIDVADTLRFDDDMMVVYSGAVIGRQKFKKLMRYMSGKPNLLHSIKGGVSIAFNEGDEIATLLDDIEAAESRTGKKGGKPPSIGKRDHKRIHKMRDQGFNAKQITEALGYDKGRHTTVWRYMKKTNEND